MSQAISPSRLVALRAYTAGQLGTRRAIEAIGAHDHADLVIALVQNNRDIPEPAATPAHEAHLARVRAILQPRLCHGA